MCIQHADICVLEIALGRTWINEIQLVRKTLPPRSGGVEPGGLDLAIVILNYNTRDLLRDCLRSVFASDTVLRFHVCVVDNASTDGSAEMVAKEFPAVHLIATCQWGL